MVEVTKGAIIALIGGAIAIIAVFLPWWTIKLTPLYVPGTVKFSLTPLLGVRSPYPYLPPGFLTYPKLVILGGLLTLAGGALLILTIVKKPLGIIGGILALGGAIAFIAIMATGQVVFFYGYYYLPGLFGSMILYIGLYFNVSWFLSIGLYLACIGAAIGLVGSLLKSKEA